MKNAEKSLSHDKMSYYTSYFQDEIAKYSYVILLLFIVMIPFDTWINYGEYAEWVHYFSAFTFLTAIVLLLTARMKKISIRLATIIFIIVFTLNIYVPGLLGTLELRSLILTSFTNLGVCYLLLILTFLSGAVKTASYLGMLNLLFILVLNYLSYNVAFLDITVLLIFASSIIFFRNAILKIAEVLYRKRMYREEIEKKKKEMNELKHQEQERRNAFLAELNKGNARFTSSMIVRMRKIQKETNNPIKNKMIDQEIKQLKLHKTMNAQLDLMGDIEIFDVDFSVRISKKYPTLTNVEQKICALLRYSFSSQEIADRLNKSAETIKWYRKRIRKKLKLKTNEPLNSFCAKL